MGLACPPFDVEDFMAAEASYFNLSEEVFFSGIEDDHKNAERVQGSSGNLKAIQIKHKKHGKGKGMKVLEQVYKHKDNARKDTNDVTKAESIESNKKILTKPEIADEVSLERKINLAKGKLRESYEQIAKEKKRRQIQVPAISESPKVPQKKCRHEKYQWFCTQVQEFCSLPVVYYKVSAVRSRQQQRQTDSGKGRFSSYYQKEKRDLFKLRCSPILGSHKCLLG